MRRVGERIEYRPAVLIGLAADGGVFVAPYQESASWRYGVLENGVPVNARSAVTEVKPKLHYHRSGWVYATLSGHELERRSLQLAPLESLTRSQIFSVLTVRTWELPSRAKPMVVGDSATPVKRWPDVARWGVFLIEAPAQERQPLLLPELRGQGLLAGDDFTHAVVSLAAYGRQALLLVTVQVTDTWDALPPVGGTTIAALPWHPGRSSPADQSFGLWSSDLRNPLIHWQPEAPASLTPTSTTSTKSMAEDIDRMAGLAVPDEGLPMRPAIVPHNDFVGTPLAVPEP